MNDVYVELGGGVNLFPLPRPGRCVKEAERYAISRVKKGQPKVEEAQVDSPKMSFNRQINYTINSTKRSKSHNKNSLSNIFLGGPPPPIHPEYITSIRQWAQSN
jgi:hypothetical protein